MIHPLRDKKQIAQRKKIIQTTIWVVAFLLVAITGILTWSGKIFTIVGRPIWRAQEAVVNTFQNNGYLVRTKQSVFAENQNLLQENADLKNQMLDYTVIKNENDQLKELMGRLPANHTFILGTILTKPNRSPYDTIIIDAGADEGLSVGMPVFANAVTPIGEINTVYPNESLVTLYSSPGQTTEAVLDGSNATVELLGRGGGNFEMTVPLDLPTDNGTNVVLPNTQSEIVAIVEDVISLPTDPVKKVILRSPINIQSLKWVEVRKN
jgi:cell shape-determining protein MreC